MFVNHVLPTVSVVLASVKKIFVSLVRKMETAPPISAKMELVVLVLPQKIVPKDYFAKNDDAKHARKIKTVPPFCVSLKNVRTVPKIVTVDLEYANRVDAPKLAHKIVNVSRNIALKNGVFPVQKQKIANIYAVLVVFVLDLVKKKLEIVQVVVFAMKTMEFVAFP